MRYHECYTIYGPTIYILRRCDFYHLFAFSFRSRSFWSYSKNERIFAFYFDQLWLCKLSVSFYRCLRYIFIIRRRSTTCPSVCLILFWTVYSRNYPMTYECFEYCTHEEALCIGGCVNNSTCTYECGIQAASCRFYCPCAEGCPEVKVESYSLVFDPAQTIISTFIQLVITVRMIFAHVEIMKRTRTT